MSIAKAVASYIVMQGRTTSDAVVRAFPHLSRKTVMKAIQNASSQRLIFIESKGLGNRWASTSSAVLCAPRPDQKRPLVNVRARVASVWELADPQPLELPDLPARRYAPLGPWSELEGAAAA